MTLNVPTDAGADVADTVITLYRVEGRADFVYG